MQWDPIFNEIGSALYIIDPEGRFSYMGSAIERITRYRRNDLVGMRISDIIYQVKDRSDNHLPSSGYDGPVRREVLLTDADSTLIKCIVTSLDMPDGGSVGSISLARPIDAETEEKIRIFTMVVEQSPATVVITDRTGAIQYVNPKFTELTGYSFNEVMGHNPRILKSGTQTPEFYATLWETISSGKEWRGDFHNLKKNGEFYWESASISPIMNIRGEITHYVAIKEDITKRKIAEEALRISEENLREKNTEMEKELQYARVVAERLLPDEPPSFERLKVAFRFLPLDAIGGDYFSFNALQDRGLGVFIGDVVGHGVSAALFLSLVRAMSERLNGTSGTLPSGYISGLNRELSENGFMFFLTALYGYFDFTDKAEFRFSKAGHTPPVFYRPEEEDPILVWSTGIPLGLSMSAEYEETRLPLRPGDRLYLYTDGIIEARSENETMLDAEGLLPIVKSARGLELGASIDRILEEVSLFRGSAGAEDDILIIGFEVI
ncbi:MAG: PAS domain S-box protein [Chrysiogenales bacterium]|nr:MAG: PAS domain S-box protein [Chrysiogenales bacterium]